MALYGLGLAADALAKSMAGLPEAQAKVESILPDFRNKITEGQMAQEKLAEAKEAAPFRIPMLKSQIALRETEAQKNLAEAAHKAKSSRMLGYKTTSDARGNTITIDEDPSSPTFGSIIAQTKAEKSPNELLDEGKLAEMQRKDLAREMFTKAHQEQITKASMDPNHKYGIPEMANLMVTHGFIDDPKELFSALLGDERIDAMYARLDLQQQLARERQERKDETEALRVPAIRARAEALAKSQLQEVLPKHIVTGALMYPNTTIPISLPAWNYMLQEKAEQIYQGMMASFPNAAKYPYEKSYQMPTQAQDPEYHKWMGTYVEPPKKGWGDPGTISGAVSNFFSTTPKAETKYGEGERAENKAAVSNLGSISLRLSQGQNVSTDEIKAALKVAGVTDPFKVNQYINNLKTMYGGGEGAAPKNELTPEENALRPEQFTQVPDPNRPRDELLGAPEVKFIMDSLEKKRPTSAPAIRDLLRKSGWNQVDMDFMISWLQSVYGPNLVVSPRRGK